MRIASRATLSFAVGFAGASFVLLMARTHPAAVSDFDQIWFAARAILSGRDPYAEIGPSRAFNWPFGFVYPMTAAVAAIPLSWMPVTVARAVFVGLGLSGFAWLVSRDGRKGLPALASSPLLMSAVLVQWAPLLAAASTCPPAAWLLAAKPNLGVALIAGAKDVRRGAITAASCLAFAALTLLVDPHWPMKWVDAVRSSPHFAAPIMRPGGFLVLAALLRWRDPQARLLVALAYVPQTPSPPDNLLLFLAVRPGVQSWLLMGLSYTALMVGRMVDQSQDLIAWMDWYGRVSTILLFVPCAAMVLWPRPASPQKPDTLSNHE